MLVSGISSPGDAENAFDNFYHRPDLFFDYAGLEVNYSFWNGQNGFLQGFDHYRDAIVDSLCH